MTDGNFIAFCFLSLQINYCYKYLCVLIGNNDVWSSKLMTAEIMQEHEKLFESMNPLRRFLKYGNVVLQEDFWVPVTEFLNEFNQYCLRHGAAKPTWTEDLYDSVFRDKDLQVKNAKFMYDEHVLKSGAVIKGCSFNNCDEKMVVVEGEDNPQYIDD